MVVYFLFVETDSLTLEETAVILDGEEYGNKLIGKAVSIAEKEIGENAKLQAISNSEEIVPRKL